MAEKESIPEKEALTSTDLAYRRTVIAEERTLMAWIRTALSLISFGFTIYKIFSETEKEADHHLTARAVGLIMIGMGLLGLLLAQIDHHKAIKILKQEHPVRQRTVAGVMALLVWIFGLFLFLAALFRN
ncbi:YidH family protein [Polluticoccus soli]|uniref:YidH family protein n=1 Tax=Polluticoccus soli TaxID=3034150 RepID=UPI0023E0EDC0|nr:DUF202 domain-containing protein [Flavipsychrobacter sp. JY13-12]